MVNMIAVLIPTFKTGNYFEDCVRSLAAQTLSKDDFHVYVALNGPESFYLSYLEKTFNKSQLNYSVFHLPEPGVSAARNFLIEKSCEPYICFVDDDDFLDPLYLESLLVASDEKTIGLANVKAFEGDIRLSRLNYIGESYSNLSYYESSILKTRKYFSSPWAKLIHRSIVGETTFDQRLSKGEDALFTAKLSKRVGGVRKASPEVVYYVRERPGSASRRRTKKMDEVKRFFYLELCYLKLLFSSGYAKAFIITRMIATFLQLLKSFK